MAYQKKKKTTTSVTSFLESEGYKEFYGLILFIVDIEHDLKKHSILLDVTNLCEKYPKNKVIT
jgi:hypothetical protein